MCGVARWSPIPSILLSCSLFAGASSGCADPAADPFSTYTGPAVEVPADASEAGASGGDDAGATGSSGATTGGDGPTPADPGSTGADAGANGATAGGGSGAPPAAVGNLTFSVLTKSLGGKYAPRNVGAIWVETASGTWVKTLAVWAGTRERYLTRYVAASKRNRVDAITSATLSSHSTHKAIWNSKDANGKVVPDGSYRIVVEVTDRNATGDSTVIPFSKGTAKVQVSPADQAHFVGMSLAYQ